MITNIEIICNRLDYLCGQNEMNACDLQELKRLCAGAGVDKQYTEMYISQLCELGRLRCQNIGAHCYIFKN